jgi:hypothetical protein
LGSLRIDAVRTSGEGQCPCIEQSPGHFLEKIVPRHLDNREMEGDVGISEGDRIVEIALHESQGVTDFPEWTATQGDAARTFRLDQQAQVHEFNKAFAVALQRSVASQGIPQRRGVRY